MPLHIHCQEMTFSTLSNSDAFLILETPVDKSGSVSTIKTTNYNAKNWII